MMRCRNDGYLIPNPILSNEEQVEIGIWGQRHLKYIKSFCHFSKAIDKANTS